MSARKGWIAEAAFLAALLLAAGGYWTFAPAPAGESVVVSDIVDGDTVVLNDGRRIRYLLIDTPEKGDPLYEEATALNRSLVAGRPVRVELDVRPKDDYGRLLAYVFVRDESGAEIFVNERIVREGLAFLYVVGEDAARREDILRAQRAAHEENKGLWKSMGAGGPCVGSMGKSGRHRFHRESCESLKNAGQLVRFESRPAALLDGRSACRSCKP